VELVFRRDAYATRALPPKQAFSPLRPSILRGIPQVGRSLEGPAHLFGALGRPFSSRHRHLGGEPMKTFRFQICPRDGAPFEIGIQAPYFGDAFRAVSSQYPDARIYPLGEA